MPSFRLVPEEPNAKLFEIVKRLRYMEWGTRRPWLHTKVYYFSTIFLIFKSSPFSFWRTNLAEAGHTHKFWCALLCDEAIPFNLVNFWLTYLNSEMASNQVFCTTLFRVPAFPLSPIQSHSFFHSPDWSQMFRSRAQARACARGRNLWHQVHVDFVYFHSSDSGPSGRHKR